jgi:glutaconate CoA-transferase subunit B
MSQSTRTFVERVDFVTSPGHRRPDGSGGRPPWAGAGPTAVVTQLGLYRFGSDGEMELVGLHHGVDQETVDAGTGWPMRRAASVLRLPTPSDEALAAIRALVA